MILDAEIAELLPALNTGFPRVETFAPSQLRAVIRERVQRPAPYCRPAVAVSGDRGGFRHGVLSPFRYRLRQHPAAMAWY